MSKSAPAAPVKQKTAVPAKQNSLKRRPRAQGNTTMARAILRPLNWLLRISASTKPKMVDSTTTATVQTRVFFSTRLKAEPLITFVKLAMPLNPLIFPALLTSLLGNRLRHLRHHTLCHLLRPVRTAKH